MNIEILSTTSNLAEKTASAEYRINGETKSVDFAYSSGDIYKIAAEKIKAIEPKATFGTLPSCDVAKIEKAGKLASLEAQYEQDKAELSKYYTEADMQGKEEVKAELREEMAELEAYYEAQRAVILEG
jgi:hypothetical protein